MAEELELEQESGPLSIRDALEAAVEKHTSEDSSANAGLEAVSPSERTRDESGKFAKVAESKPAVPADNPTLEAENAPQRPPKPSSWKKELDEHWNGLHPEVANYLALREQQYSTGVSTYKQEAERARNLQQAMEPFMPELQRYNIKPEQWIQNLGRAHQTLALGSPQQKLQMFTQLAREYNIDLGSMAGDPGAESNPIANQQTQWMQEQIAQLNGRWQQFETSQAQQHQATIDGEIQKFAAQTDKYPHFSTVRETMAGILQSGLAQDLPSAYDKAIRMHDDLWNSQQEAQRNQADVDRKAQQAAAATTARAKVVSVKSATPSGTGQNSTAQGRREQLKEALSSHGSGRV